MSVGTITLDDFIDLCYELSEIELPYLKAPSMDCYSKGSFIAIDEDGNSRWKIDASTGQMYYDNEVKSFDFTTELTLSFEPSLFDIPELYSFPYKIDVSGDYLDLPQEKQCLIYRIARKLLVIIADISIEMQVESKQPLASRLSLLEGVDVFDFWSSDFARAEP